jgi:hypothetical protein
MAASAWRMYGSAKEFIGDGTIDLDTHTFKCQLHTSAYTPNLDTHTQRSDLAGEHANQGAPGYETAGKALTTVTWVLSSGTVTWDSDNVSWTATGGSIVARYAVIYDDTTTSPVDALVCYSLLDTTPADVTATVGNTFTVTMNASGILTSSGATA